MTISTDVSVRQSFLERTSGQNGHRLPFGAWRWGRGRSLFLKATWGREEEGSHFDTSHVHWHLKVPLQQLQGTQAVFALGKPPSRGSGFLLLRLLQWTLEPETRGMGGLACQCIHMQTLPGCGICYRNWDSFQNNDPDLLSRMSLIH